MRADGLALYAFRYLWDQAVRIGVMAQGGAEGEALGGGLSSGGLPHGESEGAMSFLDNIDPSAIQPALRVCL